MRSDGNVKYDFFVFRVGHSIARNLDVPNLQVKMKSKHRMK